MSVTIAFRPLQTTTDILSNATSQTADALREVFGDSPIELNSEHVDRLEAMAVATRSNIDPNPFKQLADAVIQHGAILVEFHY